MLKAKIKKSLPGFTLEVDFAIDQEILAILGPSGSGKTMTLKCIAGLLPPDEGHIELNGRVLYDSAAKINLPARERRIGFVFQNYALFPHRTVRENAAFGITGKPKAEAEKRISWLLAKMHVDGLAHRYPRELSSGQQQRVAVARALSCEPEVLLLDEPFSALDTPRRERLELELLSLQDFYRGDILFVTHDLAQGYKLGTRLAVYDAGRMVQLDDKRAVIGAPAGRTAARLTGFKNVLDGRVAAASPGEALVSIPGLGTSLRVISGAAVSADKEVAVGIRPEHIEVVPVGGENTIAGRVSRTVESVTTVSYFFSPDGSGEARPELEVSLSKTSESAMLSVGTVYRFRLPPERLVIIL